jgi:uncharacterized protein involved in exopolysaccharide biosynthesis
MAKRNAKQAKIVDKLQKRVAKLTKQRRRVDQLSSEVEALRAHARATADRVEGVAADAFSPGALSSDGARATDHAATPSPSRRPRSRSSASEPGRSRRSKPAATR